MSIFWLGCGRVLEPRQEGALAGLSGPAAGGPSAPPQPADAEFLLRLYHEIGMRAPELAREAIVGDRMLFGRHTGWVVMLLDLHEGAPTHWDIGWTLKAKKGRPTVADCVTGFGSDPAALAAQLWISTSGACFLELVTGSATARFSAVAVHPL
ncbi:hypothetical protein [Actinoplanes regularis]|uniref:hypothetical protein n=1 Tax=Actinoplanes regularis TaxID=52697 RepID=UPI0024A37932|nr:hypothetical protein [Actinoplanes regularis]GLW31136.1 hypothetical protein Areg01_40760 [Actinoplanes regularis]